MFERRLRWSSAVCPAMLFAAVAAAFLVSCGQKSEERKTAPTPADQSSRQATTDVSEKTATQKVTPQTPVAKSTSLEAKSAPVVAEKPATPATKPQTADHAPGAASPKANSSGTATNPIGTFLKAIDQTLKGKHERAETQTKSNVHVPAVGEVAPDIEGKDLDGVPFKLSDYRGHVIVLDFWGDW